jgi:hypothetical protein
LNREEVESLIESKINECNICGTKACILMIMGYLGAKYPDFYDRALEMFDQLGITVDAAESERLK